MVIELTSLSNSSFLKAYIFPFTRQILISGLLTINSSAIMDSVTWYCPAVKVLHLEKVLMFMSERPGSVVLTWTTRTSQVRP